MLLFTKMFLKYAFLKCFAFYLNHTCSLGWKYTKLTDVVVSSIDNEKSAVLVTSDGCRNPRYGTIAPGNPEVDDNNQLIINFNFRAFLFDDMMERDAVKISAHVMGCVEAIDCSPVSTLDMGQILFITCVMSLIELSRLIRVQFCFYCCPQLPVQRSHSSKTFSL